MSAEGRCPEETGHGGVGADHGRVVLGQRANRGPASLQLEACQLGAALEECPTRGARDQRVDRQGRLARAQGLAVVQVAHAQEQAAVLGPVVVAGGVVPDDGSGRVDALVARRDEEVAARRTPGEARPDLGAQDTRPGARGEADRGGSELVTVGEEDPPDGPGGVGAQLAHGSARANLDARGSGGCLQGAPEALHVDGAPVREQPGALALGSIAGGEVLDLVRLQESRLASLGDLRGPPGQRAARPSLDHDQASVIHERAVSEVRRRLPQEAGGSPGQGSGRGRVDRRPEDARVESRGQAERSLLPLDQSDVPHAAAGQGPGEAEASHAAANDDDGALRGKAHGRSGS